MIRPFWRAFALTVLVSQAGSAQARVLSAPPEPSLLNITRQWSRASSLGDLRELRTEPDYRELRVWAGFGLTAETQGVVLRRANGRWSAFFARVMRCEIQIPMGVRDTASRATMQLYTSEARQHCGTAVADVRPGAQVLTTDTLLVGRLNAPDSTIEAAWAAARARGGLPIAAARRAQPEPGGRSHVCHRGAKRQRLSRLRDRAVGASRNRRGSAGQRHLCRSEPVSKRYSTREAMIGPGWHVYFSRRRQCQTSRMPPESC